jgi:tetratricopeptide (TPR) repeat protein
MITSKTSFTINPIILTVFLLSLTNVILYWNVQNFEFIILDDPAYVYSNPIVQNGLSLKGLKWTFESFDYNTANWHPLTWLSLMIDMQLYGLNAGGYHWTNLFFHIANTVLLFIVFHYMTKTVRQSALVALLFAVHPLHVESVAWVSSRKDVLSTMFWLFAIWSYLRYTKHPSWKYYCLTLLFFACGLMAKPMVVTLPFVLILLDYWPLNRLKQKESDNNLIMPGVISSNKTVPYLFLEKTPFFILSVISSVITYIAQQSGEAVQSLTNLPLTFRIANSFVAYLTYITKTVWPHNLAVFYPLPEAWPLWHILLAVIFVISITVIVILFSKSKPYIFTGWFWFTGTLIPVIGLVQVGSQSMADRYTYIPLVGLFIIIIWGVTDVINNKKLLTIYLHLIITPVITTLMLMSWLQIQYWENSMTVFKRAISITRNNYIAHDGMGVVLRMAGDLDRAEHHFKEALHIRPKYSQAHANIGLLYFQRNEIELSKKHFIKAIHFSPRFKEARLNLGHLYLFQKKYKEAIFEYNQILKYHADDAEAHNYLGVALICENNIDGAIREFNEALRIQPNYTKAQINLTNAREIKNILLLK